MSGWNWAAVGVAATVIVGVVPLLALWLRERRLRHEDLTKLVEEAVDRRIGVEVGTTFFNLLRTQRILEKRAESTLETLESEVEAHRQQMAAGAATASNALKAAEVIEQRLGGLVEQAESRVRELEKDAEAASETVDSMADALEYLVRTQRADLQELEKEQVALRKAIGPLADRASDKAFPKDIAALWQMQQRLGYLEIAIDQRRDALESLENTTVEIKTMRPAAISRSASWNVEASEDNVATDAPRVEK